MMYRILLIIICLQSCVSSSMIDDAQALGKGNSTLEGAVARAIYTPTSPEIGLLARFYQRRDIGTLRASYIYGIEERTNVGIALDLPVGLQVHMKHLFLTSELKHLHAIKAEILVPLSYYLSEENEFPVATFSPSYIYTFRHDDLLSFSINAGLLSIQTNKRLVHLPGLATGIHIGDEIRFSAGVSYYNNFSSLGASGIQYLSVEASIKYDL